MVHCVRHSRGLAVSGVPHGHSAVQSSQQISTAVPQPHGGAECGMVVRDCLVRGMICCMLYV